MNKIYKLQKGFTLIELMIVVAIIGILATIVWPSYVDYVRSGKAAEATSNLADLRIRMEQYFQDNKTYMDAGGLTAPCSPAAGSARFFSYACSVQTATNFTITATPTANADMANFEFTINEANAKTSKYDGFTPISNTCWVTKKGGIC